MQAAVKKPFTGPVFIVGMPRSGTKLLRALLNQHPRISITLAESHFIPYFIRKFGIPPSLQKGVRLERFVKALLNSPFFATMNKAGYSFDRASFVRSVDLASWSSIFEYILKNFGSKKSMEDAIWGDKTPGYVNHLPLLKNLFPQAKFIHMIRDPRDYCLSVKKSWGKSPYRAAHRWKSTLEKVRSYGDQVSSDLKEIQYESLLNDPEMTMESLCEFLECEYDEGLLEISLSPEDVGDTKGQYGIVRDNMGKYTTQFTSDELRRIEQIVFPVARTMHYIHDNNVAYKPLTWMDLSYLKIYDGLASLRYHIRKERGLSKGVRRFLHHYTKSSWRDSAPL